MPSEQIISKPEELAEFCMHVASCPVFGFDTEFIGEETFVPDLCLVQVATPERLAVIDPLTVGVLDSFWRLVADPARITVVHAGREEIRSCQRCLARLPENIFDLQVAAGLAGSSFPMGHGPLIQQILGVKLHKGETLTDWKKRPLTKKQIHYAFDDVRYLLPLWEKISQRLEQLGRVEWAREENAALVRRSVGDEPGVERWRKLSGLGRLDRRRLAIVRALSDWRERKAARQNRPVRSVVRDDLIVEIARRNPKDEHDLAVMRGLAKRDFPELLQVVQQARDLPADQTPDILHRDEDPPQNAVLAGLLSAVLGDLCSRLGLSQSLVASSADLKQFIRCSQRGEPLPETSPLAAGWRAAAIAPELRDVLAGERSVRIAALNRESPLDVQPRT